jgi:hypothetical protein
MVVVMSVLGACRRRRATRNSISKGVFSQLAALPLLRHQIVFIGRFRPCDCQLARAVRASAGGQGNWPGLARR